MPRAAAYSISANSETSGAPGPAMGRARSPNVLTWWAAHSPSASTVFSTAQSTVSSRRSTSTSAAAWRLARSAPRRVSVVVCAASVMGLLQHRPPTVEAPKSGLCTGVGESSWVKISRSTAGVLARRWLRCERSEPRNHPCGGESFRGSALAPLAPQPARGLRLLLGVRGLATVGPGGPPYSTNEVVRWLRCERSEPRNHHSSWARFRGSGLAALAPQPARGSRLLLGVRGLATVGPGGPPYSTSEVVRWLRCERSEPRNHHSSWARFRGSGLAALAPQPAPGSRLLLGVRGLATVGPGGPPYSTSGVVRWLRCERSEPRNHPRRESVSWLGPGGPRTSTSAWGRGCFSAYGVSLRSAPGGLPTRPTRRSGG